MSGVARTSVPDPSAYQDPKDPPTSARSARGTSNPRAISVIAVPAMIATANPGATHRALTAVRLTGEFFGLRSRAHAASRSRQSANRGDAGGRTHGEHRERPAPPDHLDDRRHKLDRDHRQQKAE